MSEDAFDSRSYFRGRGFDVRIEECELHAEYMAREDPGRASFFVEHQRYFCVDLTRSGSIVARRYAHGETADAALEAARRRFGSEQA